MSLLGHRNAQKSTSAPVLLQIMMRKMRQNMMLMAFEPLIRINYLNENCSNKWNVNSDIKALFYTLHTFFFTTGHTCKFHRIGHASSKEGRRATLAPTLTLSSALRPWWGCASRVPQCDWARKEDMWLAPLTLSCANESRGGTSRKQVHYRQGWGSYFWKGT